MITKEKAIEKEFLAQQDLVIISLDSWKRQIDAQSGWLNNTPTVLIVKP